MKLAQEHYYFKTYHDDIVKDHMGEWVVIKGNSVFGYYPQMYDAIGDMASKKIELETFAVYKCEEKFPSMEVSSVWTV
jgi:hypothetical protein